MPLVCVQCRNSGGEDKALLEWMTLGCFFSGIEGHAEKAMQGAGILLNQERQEAWRMADCLCEYGAGRLLRIRLRVKGRFFSVLSCYAPTFRCSDQEKDEFYEAFGKMLDKVPLRDELVILGDFNARVGLAERALEAGGDGLSVTEMVGVHGLPERNENGVRLLDFCAARVQNSLRVASTFFQHREYGTWRHQSSKRWFQIDHVLCSRQTLGLVTDVKVMPGYIHNTDHRFLRLQLAVPPKAYLSKFYRSEKAQVQAGRPKRLLVGGLKDSVVSSDFNQQLHSLMSEGFFDEGYPLFGRAIRKVARQCLGEVPGGKCPEWKLVFSEELAALSQHKRQIALSAPGGFQSEE